MIWKGITMIIRKEIDVKTLPFDLMTNQRINAIRWEIVGDYRRREEYLQHLISQLYDYSTKNNFDLYLVLGDDCFNDNSRIIQYYKLWKLLKKQHLEVRNAIYSDEIMITKNNKVKFFGGIHCFNLDSKTNSSFIIVTRGT